MGTHVVIDARSKKARATFDTPDEGTTIFALDLISDSWDDFLYFTEQARISERADDLTKRNRYVRVATAALFSHLEGIVSDVFILLQGDSSFASYQPKNAERCSLKRKTDAVHKFLIDNRNLRCSAPSLELKLLRDVVNHPTITKETTKPGTRETVLLDASNVYGISVQELEAAGRELDRWLTAVCTTVPYQRSLDTKRLAEEFAKELGGETPCTKRF